MSIRKIHPLKPGEKRDERHHGHRRHEEAPPKRHEHGRRGHHRPIGG
ncbi:hypothetical protein [Streptomyces sp. NPDC093109]